MCVQSYQLLAVLERCIFIDLRVQTSGHDVEGHGSVCLREIGETLGKKDRGQVGVSQGTGVSVLYVNYITGVCNITGV